MYNNIEYRKRMRARNDKIKAALTEKNASKLKKLLYSNQAAPFISSIIKINSTDDQKDLSIEIVIEGEIYEKILKLIKNSLNKAMMQRSFDGIMHNLNQIVMPLNKKLSMRLQKSRLVQLIGMEFPYYIQIIRPHRSIINHALDHYSTKTFQCLMDSPLMNAANLAEPGRRDGPLIHAINLKNTEAVNIILSSRHLSMALLRKNQKSLENTAIGRAIITNQMKIVETLLNKTHDFYQQIYSMDYREYPVSVSLFYQDSHTTSVLSLAASLGRKSILNQLLVMGGEYFNRFPTYLINALNAAIDARQHECISILINQGFYPATHKELLRITRRSHPELTKYILRCITIGCNRCLSTLMTSRLFQEHCLNTMANNVLLLKTVEAGKQSIVQTFLEHPYLKDKQTETLAQCYTDTHYNALHIAVINESIDITEYLANHFPQLMLRQDLQFHTPIHHAVLTNNLQVLNALMNEKTINQESARVVSSILQHPHEPVETHTLDYLRHVLIAFDRQRTKPSIQASSSETAPSKSSRASRW